MNSDEDVPSAKKMLQVQTSTDVDVSSLHQKGASDTYTNWQ